MPKEYNYFLIRCKKCGNTMKYMTAGAIESIGTKKKKCVYCGFTNSVKNCIMKKTEK